MKNNMWDIVIRSEGRSMVTSKWIYKIMHAVKGNIEKHKARFLERGFSYKEGVNYEDTFAPSAKYTSIKTSISHASVMGWRLHHINANIKFLNGVIEEEVYIEQPEGFVIYEEESHVCILRIPCMNSSRHPRLGVARFTPT